MVIAENCSCDENGLNRRCSSYENEVSERLMSFCVTCFLLNQVKRNISENQLADFKDTMKAYFC